MWKIFKESFKLFKSHFLKVLAVLFIVLVVSVALRATISVMPDDYLTTIVGLWIFLYFCGLVFELGLARFLLDLADGDNPKIRTLFSQALKTGQLFLAQIVLGVITLATITPLIFAIFILEKYIALAIILAVIGTVLTVYVGTRLRFLAFSMVDFDCGPIDAIKYCWKATEKNFWWVFLWQVLLSLLNLLIIPVPITIIANAVFYKKLVS